MGSFWECSAFHDSQKAKEAFSLTTPRQLCAVIGALSAHFSDCLYCLKYHVCGFIQHYRQRVKQKVQLPVVAHQMSHIIFCAIFRTYNVKYCLSLLYGGRAGRYPGCPSYSTQRGSVSGVLWSLNRFCDRACLLSTPPPVVITAPASPY